MRVFSLILVICLIYSCTEDNIIEVIKSEDDKLEIEFYNSRRVYDLDNYGIPIGFKLKNISNEDIKIGAILFNNRLFLPQIVQHKRDGIWITDYELTIDTFFVLKAQEYLPCEFFVFLKGEWRTLINLGNGDTLYSKSVIVINEMEKLIDFNIKCLESNLIEVKIQNNSEINISLLNQKFPYCHFSFMLYDFVDSSMYTRLYWNDYYSKWDFTFPLVGDVCQMDPPEIIVLAGEEYVTLIDDVMPQGIINARLRFYFTNNNNHYETISKTFEYY